jgi:anti-anti-sigma factor
MGALELQIRRERSATILTLNGRLDGNTSELFGRFIDGNIQEADRNVILDLTQLEFISSAGLREFLNLAKLLNKRQLKAGTAGTIPAVSLSMEIAGFTALFNHYTTLEQALSPETKPTRKGLFYHFFG